MVKDKGKIVNSNLLTLSNFFEYESISDIKNVKIQYMICRKEKLANFYPWIFKSYMNN
jgi:hypothetical protein